jgi:probable HAF family extracellular repeat protein
MTPRAIWQYLSLNHSLRLIATGIIAQCCASGALALPLYTVRDLGTLGSRDSYPVAINSAGVVAGASTLGGLTHPVVFGTAGGSIIDLAPLASPGAMATGINDLGQVVGFVDITNWGYRYAALFNSTDGSITNLGTLGGRDSYADSINNSGQVLGYSSTVTGAMHATLFSIAGGSNMDLGTLGGENSYGFGLNELGQAVGYSDTLSGHFHATLFSTTGGQNVDLGTNGGMDSYALGINDFGQVVGYTSNSSGQQRATLFSTTGGSNTYLSGLDGLESTAWDINNSGQIIGYVHLGQGRLDPYIWQSGVMTLLDSVIDPLSEWDLQQALEINDAGQIAVSGCSRITGECHALLLNTVGQNVGTVPEPSTLALLVLAILSMAAKLRRIGFSFDSFGKRR